MCPNILCVAKYTVHNHVETFLIVGAPIILDDVTISIKLRLAA